MIWMHSGYYRIRFSVIALISFAAVLCKRFVPLQKKWPLTSVEAWSSNSYHPQFSSFLHPIHNGGAFPCRIKSIPIEKRSATYCRLTKHMNGMTLATRKTSLCMSNDQDRMEILRDVAEKQKTILSDPSWNTSLPLIDIQELHAESVDDKQKILNGVNLKIFKGEKHAVMGRNGSGKSTLSKIIAGHPAYNVVSGSAFYKGVDLLAMPVDMRALAGIFLAFQYPVEIPMVKNSEFLRVALNEKRKFRNETELEPLEFNMLMYEKLQYLGLNEDFIDRPLNYGFSGGEKKRNEILQMLVLEPELCLLDETDSGLDVDSFRITAGAVKEYGGADKSFLVVTHYKKLLDFLQPDYVHVMHKGKIIKVGDTSIAAKLEHSGFGQFLDDDDTEAWQ